MTFIYLSNIYRQPSKCYIFNRFFFKLQALKDPHLIEILEERCPVSLLKEHWNKFPAKVKTTGPFFRVIDKPQIRV